MKLWGLSSVKYFSSFFRILFNFKDEFFYFHSREDTLHAYTSGTYNLTINLNFDFSNEISISSWKCFKKKCMNAFFCCCSWLSTSSLQLFRLENRCLTHRLSNQLHIYVAWTHFRTMLLTVVMNCIDKNEAS